MLSEWFCDSKIFFVNETTRPPMLNGAQEDELIRKIAARHSVAPELLTELLALAPRFQNFNIYGTKVEFTRAVEQILDKVDEIQKNGDHQ